MTDSAAVKAQFVGIFDRASATYDQVGVDFFGPVAADLVAAAGLRPGQRVLDVGCGRGANLFAAAQAVGPAGRVTGTDLAPGMVAATRAEAQRRGLSHVEVRTGDAEAPDLPDGSLDAVLAGLVIFFLPDAPAAVRAYRRLLRPGGRLALSTFAAENDGDRTLTALVATALGPFLPPPPQPATPAPHDPRTSLRTRESLSELLTGAGFTDVRFVERGYPLRFADPQRYWEWLWSAGARAALEQVPPDRLDDARAALVAGLDAIRDPAGGFTLTLEVRLTTATAG